MLETVAFLPYVERAVKWQGLQLYGNYSPSPLEATVQVMKHPALESLQGAFDMKALSSVVIADAAGSLHKNLDPGLPPNSGYNVIGLIRDLNDDHSQTALPAFDAQRLLEVAQSDGLLNHEAMMAQTARNND